MGPAAAPTTQGPKVFHYGGGRLAEQNASGVIVGGVAGNEELERGNLCHAIGTEPVTHDPLDAGHDVLAGGSAAGNRRDVRSEHASCTGIFCGVSYGKDAFAGGDGHEGGFTFGRRAVVCLNRRIGTEDRSAWKRDRYP
jgi:hypothetical protein